MSWYKDRDFPELKRDLYNEPSEILAVILNPKDLDRVIEVHNNEVKEILMLAEQWRDSYNEETRRLRIENIHLKQMIEDLEYDFNARTKKTITDLD